MSKTEKYTEIKKLLTEHFDTMSKVICKKLSETTCSSKQFEQDISNYLLGNSKQIRSCLIFLFSKNLDIKIDDEIIKLAAAVEIIHNATLIHDDIIDEANERRGQKTLNLKYGNKLAVISGDFLLTLALNILIELPPQIMKNFSTCLQNLVKGEINQYFAQNKTPSINEYIEKSKCKTASLFLAATKSLADLRCPQYTTILDSFAMNFGIAFQIRDDLKNFKSTDNKPVLNDLYSGIYTAPVIYAFGEEKNLSKISTNEILEKTNTKEVLNKTNILLNQYINNAIKQLNYLPQNHYSVAMKTLCKMLESD